MATPLRPTPKATIQQIDQIAQTALEQNPNISEVSVEKGGIKITYTRKVVVEEKEKKKEKKKK